MSLPVLGLSTFDVAFSPLWLILGAFCGLAVVSPELAFRYSNIFQLREVELTGFGVVLHVGGALLSLVVVFPYFLATSPAIGPVSALAFYGGAGVLLIRHWPPTY